MNIPENIEGAIERYVHDRLYPGSFVRAVLENDLLNAVCHADSDSLAALKQIVLYVHWEIRADCHGSPERVQAWLENRRVA